MCVVGSSCQPHNKRLSPKFALIVSGGGAQRVQELLQATKEGTVHVVLSVLNFGEVTYITERERSLTKAHEVLAAVEQLPIELLPATQVRVIDAAHIKANYRVAFADVFAIASAVELQAIVLTGDPEFRSVEGVIEVGWLPKGSDA